MGGAFNNIAKLGATGAATAAGGPLAGLAATSALGMGESLLGGGNFYEMMGSGATSGLGAYLGGQLKPQQPSLLDVLNSRSNQEYQPRLQIPAYQPPTLDFDYKFKV